MLKQKIKKLLIGTNNKGKLREIKNLLPKNIKIYSTSQFNLKSPMENGKTFKENSLIKSKYFSIASPYPNPFNNKLTIPIEVKKHGEVRAEIFNISGQLLDVVHSGYLRVGTYELIWDAKNYSSGLYIIQTSLNHKIKYEKTVLLK